ncbi:RING/U-box superfamily protein, partial [Prunus dulcis]
MFTKTGSLCCVAARPHESHTASRDWSVGPEEPCWRTNTSFSPPHRDGISDSNLKNYSMQHGSSTSSNSKGSRGWVRGNNLYNHHYSASDGAALFLSSSSDLSQGPQWTPPAIQEISIDDYETAKRRGNFRNSRHRGSSSSRSDSSESEPALKACLSSHHTLPSRRSFMSKPIHPLSFPAQTPPREASDLTLAGFTEFDAATPQRDGHRWSSASSSIDFADVSESFEAEISGRPCNNMSDECLEQTTPKTRKNDPPCPLCARFDEENLPEQQGFSRLRTGFPRLRPISDDGPSRPWDVR